MVHTGKQILVNQDHILISYVRTVRKWLYLLRIWKLVRDRTICEKFYRFVLNHILSSILPDCDTLSVPISLPGEVVQIQ